MERRDGGKASEETIRMRIKASWRRAAAAMGICLIALSAKGDDKRAISPAEARLKADVTFLADDAREGRAPGTKGIEASADYIAAEFKRLGLKPAPGAEDYFQTFELKGDLEFVKPPTLTIANPPSPPIEAKFPADFSPLVFGRGVDLKNLPLVFAGYGITSKPDDHEKAPDYDDYEGIDVKNQAVLIFRRAPRFDIDEELFGGARPNAKATFFQKVLNAAKHGAKAVLLVNDLAGSKGEADSLLPTGSIGAVGGGTPFFMITRELGDKILALAGAPDLERLEREISKDLKPRSRRLGRVEISLETEVERKPIKTKNVVGCLEGSGPLADETIVVGAHYDHLGRGGTGSLSPGSREIHNGADDNASGTATVLEMARRLSARRDPLPRRVVFITFTAEERGLIGSAYYVNHPLFPIDKTVAMINFDMVGRLNDRDELMVYGTGSSRGLGSIVDSLGRAEGFSIRSFADGRDQDPDARYFAASDHFSFYLKKIPVLFLFTGVHADYHRPTDDSNLINYAGMARIADLGELLLLDLCRRPVRPNFADEDDRSAKAGSKPHAHDSTPNDVSVSRKKVEKSRDPAHLDEQARPMAYLGAVPDYGSEEDGKGVRLADVTKAGPAFKAGLKKADKLIRLGNIPIGDLRDYADALRSYQPGDKVEIIVLRDGKAVTLSAVLGSRGAPGS